MQAGDYLATLEVTAEGTGPAIKDHCIYDPRGCSCHRYGSTLIRMLFHSVDRSRRPTLSRTAATRTQDHSRRKSRSSIRTRWPSWMPRGADRRCPGGPSPDRRSFSTATYGLKKYTVLLEKDGQQQHGCPGERINDRKDMTPRW